MAVTILSARLQYFNKLVNNDLLSESLSLEALLAKQRSPLLTQVGHLPRDSVAVARAVYITASFEFRRHKAKHTPRRAAFQIQVELFLPLFRFVHFLYIHQLFDLILLLNRLCLLFVIYFARLGLY